MPLQIIKQLAVEEDIVWGIGEVVQPRDTDGDGVAEDVTYTKVSSSSMPHQNLNSSITDVQTELNNKYSKAESDARFAQIDGDATQDFEVADPTINTHAVPKGYLETYLAGQLADYVLRSEVLTKTNVIAYDPTSAYHPATKKYVDETLVAIGAGDMAKVIYDTNNSGIVDNSEALQGLGANDFMRYRGSSADVDALTTIGYWDAENAVGAPTAEEGIVTVRHATGGIITQDYHVIRTNATWYRSYSGGTWSAWVDTSSDIYIQDDLLGTNDPNAALGADQGRILAEQISQVSSITVPVGGIVMWAGTYSQIPSSWALCNGSNGTPDLRGRFIQGTSTESDMKTRGGQTNATMPSHNHGLSTHTHTMNHNHPVDSTSAAGNHKHTFGASITNIQGGTTGFTHGVYAHGNSSTSTTGSHSHTYSVEQHTGSTAAGGPTSTHTKAGSGDNRPLYYTLAYIQRKS